MELDDKFIIKSWHKYVIKQCGLFFIYKHTKAIWKINKLY